MTYHSVYGIVCCGCGFLNAFLCFFLVYLHAYLWERIFPCCFCMRWRLSYSVDSNVFLELVLLYRFFLVIYWLFGKGRGTGAWSSNIAATWLVSWLSISADADTRRHGHCVRISVQSGPFCHALASIGSAPPSRFCSNDVVVQRSVKYI